MFTTFAGGWPSLVLWMFHRSWHSSVVLGEACALDVNTFLLRLGQRSEPSFCAPHAKILRFVGPKCRFSNQICECSTFNGRSVAAHYEVKSVQRTYRT